MEITERASPTAERYPGLTPEEIVESREKHGINVLTPPKKEPWWKLYLEKYNDPIIRILLIAAIIALGVGILEKTYAEAMGIIIAIFLATTMAFINENRASREFDLRNKVNDDTPVKVIRGGTYMAVPKKDLVVDDIVMVEVGEEIPADAEVLEAVSFQVNEAMLTGESEPNIKAPAGSSEAQGETTYPSHMLYRGTLVSDGNAVCRVTAVGDSTELGRIGEMVTKEDEEETPLNQQLQRLSDWIGVIAFIVAFLLIAALITRGVITGDIVLSAGQWIFTAILGLSACVAFIPVWLPIVYTGLSLTGREVEQPSWLEGEGIKLWLKAIGIGAALFAALTGASYAAGIIPRETSQWLPLHTAKELLEYFMLAVTIIVVAVPEGLPMSVTLSLAYSMRRMIATNNLVRRMHACETIGAATVICSDKTGTLTQNEMRLHDMSFPSIHGNQFSCNGESRSKEESLIIESFTVNSTANLGKVEGKLYCPLGNPTECALLLWLGEKGCDYAEARSSFALKKQLPFDTRRKFMATLGDSSATGSMILHVKGAPEIIMDFCTSVSAPDGRKPLDQQRAAIEKEIVNFQSRGMRVIGFACREVQPEEIRDDLQEMVQGLTWLGFAAIADPVRPEVPDAIKTCQDAGILVKIITGDNKETATEIARQINLWDASTPADAIMTGKEFAKLGNEEALEKVENLRILSRAHPLDKLRFVDLLQKKNHVVAVTGDGTNDAPALNEAQVGFSMGITGSSTAKQASDIILLDDSFKSIVNAVMWGRSLYENIQRFILFQLTINVAALAIALLGPFIGVKLPLTVTQMLWVNLIMDTFAALALATEPPHWSVMERPPRKPADFIVTKPMAQNILTFAIFFIIVLVAFLLYIQGNGDVDIHELTLFFTTFVMLQFWNLFNARCLGQNHSAFHGLFENRSFLLIAAAIVIGQILFVQFGGAMFRTVPLSLNEWLIITCSTSLVLWAGEISRLVQRMKASPKQA
jgi:Ca2+-transporting ATPase